MFIATREQLENEPEEKRLQIARELQEKALALLKWPLYRTAVKVGPEALTVIVEPAGWDFSDVLKMFIVGQELQDRAMEALRRRAAERWRG